MNFNESITLNTYSDKANKQFNDIQSRLSKIESNFQSRMNGKTTGGLIVSFIGTLLWIAAFIACAVVLKNMVDKTILAITLVAVMGLMAFMLIDNIMNFSYYGKISSYKNSISQLKNRVSIGKNAIKANHDAFIASKAKGWNYLLSAGDSIPEEATSIETTMTSLESLKKGFINGAKNVFFYAATVMITIAGCVALFPTGSAIINNFTGDSIPNDVLPILTTIAMVIVAIVQVILAKLVWSKTDCTVTNATLFIMALGPIAFLALIAVVTLLVILVIAVVQIVLYIIGAVIVIAIAIGCLCGG